MRILLIESSEHDAGTVREELAETSEATADVVVATTLSEGVERAREKDFDAVLLDLNLPDSGGLDTLRGFEEAHPELPVVVLTGLDDEKLGIQAVQRGAQDYLVKGDRPGRLMVKTLRYAVERNRPPVETREDLMRIAGRVGRIGGWALDLDDEKVRWSDEVARIHGMPPGTQPSLEEALAFYTPESTPVIDEAFKALIRDGTPYDLDLEIEDADGNRVAVRAVGEAVRDAAGRIVRVQGAFQDITERKEAERALRESEKRFRTLAESMPIMVWIADAEGSVEFLTEGFSEYTGLDRGDLRGSGWVDIVHPDDRDAAIHAWSRSLEEQAPYEIECRLERHDGTYRWHLVRADPVRDEDGVLQQWYGSAVDIHDRRESEARLAESEERFRSVARATNDAIWDWNLTTDEVWWSDGVEDLFGVSRSDLAPDSTSWTDRIHPEDRERVERGIRAVIGGDGNHWEDEYRFRRGDGSWALVEDRGFVIRNDHGGPVRMVGGMTDVTREREVEQKLEEQAALLEEAQDAILVLDLEHVITYWNRGAERVYGWTSEEAVGRPLHELLDEDPDDLDEVTEDVLERGRWTREVEQVTKDGTRVTVEGHWTLMRDDDGEPDRILLINTDITERQKLLQQFLRAQRMESIGTLAGGIAHDLNNVLAPILMSLELLQEIVEDEEAREMLETIKGSAERGAAMVKQVLAFSRGTEGNRAPVELKQIVADLAGVVRDTFPKNIDFHADVPSDLWPMVGDSTQIHQLLMNLLVNARDAMPDGGELEVRAENERIDEQYAALSDRASPGPHVRISVSDTGVGMTEEVADQIFDPFFTTKSVGSGTGLGLSTVAAIVRGHDGFVNVYSEPGRGTTFRIYLPANRSPSRTEPEEPPDEVPPRGDGEVVLLVDDEPSVLSVTRKTLEAFGYRVLTADDGAEALAVYGRRSEEISIVLTDFMMPILDGPGMIQALKRMDPEVKVIGASGLTTDGEIARAADLGVEHFLPKPYTAEALLRTLHRALRGDESPGGEGHEDGGDSGDPAGPEHPTSRA